MLNFQQMIAKLTQYWAEQGCLIHQGYDLEVGAGTFNPATFLRSLGPEPYSAVYVEPSRRPQDGRYGENPNRVQFYHQMQVILKPSPPDIQELYLHSLAAIGIDFQKHDVRFVHDDWENPTIGAWGLGWEIWLDGMEVTQFTYFQAVGGIPVKPVSGELTYGLERLAMYIQGVDSIFDLLWNDQIRYGDIYQRSEWEWSHYNFKEADTAMWHRHFEDFEAEAKRLIRNQFPIPAYDFIMKASHAFNLLDARGVISVTERTGYMGRIRKLARQLAECYLESREAQAFPLLHLLPKKTAPSSPQLPESLSNPKEKEDFLLEIGVEELPATFVPIGTHHLKQALEKYLASHQLAYDHCEVYGTPRRLAIYIKNLAGGTHPLQKERKGPAIARAFETDGNVSKAGYGFFHSLDLEPPTLSQIQKGEISQVEIRALKGEDYLFVTQNIPGKSTRYLLAQDLSQLILSLDFPKKMRWGDHDFEFARPIRWLVALYDSEVIPISIGNIHSDRLTYGHRFLSPESITLAHPSDYLNSLRDHYVMASIEERKNSILDQLNKITQGQPIALEEVLPQVTHLVEWPQLTVGNFDKAYLQAPKEVLISEMVEHQKYFPLQDKKGNLLPHFVITCNQIPSELIQKGNEMALNPRLADGRFLYEEDLKTPLNQFSEKLKAITYQKALGSMEAKVQRIEKLATYLQQHLPLTELPPVLRAAQLCKSDLATELVGEFPELQGIIGEIYALHQGELPEVAQAIKEHWMPLKEGAALPQSPCGILLSLAEKTDNLISLFAIGLKPSSSSDPHGLRRQTLGLIKILINGKHLLNIPALFQEARTILLQTPNLPHKTSEEIQSHTTLFKELESFILARLRTILLDHFAKDEIEAILSLGLTDIYDLYLKVEALHTFRQKQKTAFQAILEVHHRTKKILLSQKPKLLPTSKQLKATEENSFPPLNPKVYTDPHEKQLLDTITTLSQKIQKACEEQNYEKAFECLPDLQKPLANFFDHVKVIDDDLTLRTQRLSLLQEAWNLCENLLDFSKIQEL